MNGAPPAASGRTRVCRAPRLLAACAVLALLAGCNRQPALAALAETDAALARVRPDLAREAPAELARIEADRARARAQIVAGQYTEALRIAQSLPGRVAIAASAAEWARRNEAQGWAQAASSLPAEIEAVQARIAQIESTRGYPRGLDAVRLEAAKADLGAAIESWSQAQARHGAADVAGAVRVATEARARVAELAARLGAGQEAAAATPLSTTPGPVRAAPARPSPTPTTTAPAAPPPQADAGPATIPPGMETP